MTLSLHRELVPVGSPLALAIGNFDGVHRGHQRILDATVATANTQALTPAAMSFHPLPREFFAGPGAPARLMSTSEKLAAFQRCGMAHAFIPKFDAAFAAQSPDDFIAKLVEMNVKWLMVGEDFRFGAKRMGDAGRLRLAGREQGFTVETTADITNNDKRISSTAVRNALAAGEFAYAAKMLGHRYEIVGRVLHGKKLGRTLGFPTANISLTHRKPALGGVFAVKCRLVTRGLEGVASKSGVILNGVANLGTNPVVSSENRPHLEVFLLDFSPAASGDLYGKRIAVQFIEKIRDEQKFASLDALVVQMHDDTAKARNILARMDHGTESR
jgi:riboflavin kinase/FMN adenylyltransferase